MSTGESATRTAAVRRRILLGVWLLAGFGILARAVEVQVLQGSRWEEVALGQQRKSLDVPAPRGAIVDRSGAPLALSHERIRVSVAPREVEDIGTTAELLESALGVDGRSVEDALRSSDPWVVLAGRYPPAIGERLSGIRGVYLERELERLLPHAELALGVIGRVRDDRGAGGVEQAFDTILAGSPGREVQARDNIGRPIPGETYTLLPPASGGEVELTLDLELQEIGREALSAAIGETGAKGGDLLITDPTTGEILSLVSLGEGGAPTLTAVNAPYEPGSTFKPFTVAGLLDGKLATLGDMVDAEGGRWTVAGRTLTDVGTPQGSITLARALQVSSNVGIAKAAAALSPVRQYETLRDFGFGAPTGIELPGEAAGTLRHPDEWSRQSPASLAIGYEVAVTPVQMAMAYGALANGGWLMEPRIVREVRAPDGTVLQRREPRRIRRAVSPATAAALSDVLVDVVEDGTGTEARLATFQVAGKSGTTRAYTADAGYEAGKYVSSFVGFFPAKDPQLVVFVKLVQPEGSYYGGATAAPVTRSTLEAILAARRTPLDRRALVTMARRAEPPEELRAASNPVVLAAHRVTPRSGGVPAVPSDIPTTEPESGGLDRGPIPVPDVRGLPLRAAARRMHALGFRVELDGAGTVTSVDPAPGRRLEPSDTIRLGGAR